jgi:hypothetical protein
VPDVRLPGMLTKVHSGLAVALLVGAAAMAVPVPVTAQGEPKAPAPEDPPFLEGQDRVDIETPAMRVERPSDSWMFLNLEVLQRQAREARQDVSGYLHLKARLWHGSTRSNIFVHAQPDTVNRAEPPTPQAIAEPLMQGLVQALTEGKVEQQGAVRVGNREGWSFEVHGRPRGEPNGALVAIMRAVVYRNEDHQIFMFTLEATADKIGPLKKDFGKLLKKSRV